jgi:hypothetical protein
MAEPADNPPHLRVVFLLNVWVGWHKLAGAFTIGVQAIQSSNSALAVLCVAPKTRRLKDTHEVLEV